jgi:hypothetical protein
MKKILLLLSFTGLLWIAAAGQKQDSAKTNKSSKKLGIGLKAGLNFSNVTNVSSINGRSQTGFHAGLVFGSFNKGLIGFRTELLYSQQGYGYTSGSTQGSVGLNYIFLAPMLAINVTRFVQIQAGFQTGYLLNAKADNGAGSTGNQTADKIIQFYNRFDYGFCGGLEIHPVGGLLIGARYNISLSNLYKMPDTSDSTGTPSYVPSSSGINFKNNVVQLFVGYRF